MTQIVSRATPSTFWSGFPIAFLSGIGIALSVLDDQTSRYDEIDV